MKNLWPGLLFAVTVLALVALFMRPRASMLDLKPETAAEITARVIAEEATEQAQIAADVERARLRTNGTIAVALALGFGVPLSIAALGLVRLRQQPPPAALVLYAGELARQGRNVSVEVVDGEWSAVDHDARIVYPVAALPAPADQP